MFVSRTLKSKFPIVPLPNWKYQYANFVVLCPVLPSNWAKKKERQTFIEIESEVV